MSVANGYCTLAALKNRLAITTTASDAALERVIEAVSRQIDAWTNRRFYAVSETRYYTAEYHDYLDVDDVVSVTSVVVDTGGDRTYPHTMGSTTYDLLPHNAPLNAEPYTAIQTNDLATLSFPLTSKGVKVTGAFGFCQTASERSDIVEACLLQSMRLWRRKDAPFGVAGVSEMGQAIVISRLDPDVQQLISRYRRLV